MVGCIERTPNIKKHPLPFLVAVHKEAAPYTTRRMASTAAAAVEVCTTTAALLVPIKTTPASSSSGSTTTNGKPYKYSVHMILRWAAARNIQETKKLTRALCAAGRQASESYIVVWTKTKQKQKCKQNGKSRACRGSNSGHQIHIIAIQKWRKKVDVLVLKGKTKGMPGFELGPSE